MYPVLTIGGSKMNCINCDKETKNLKFCSHSCSTIYNNKLYPRVKPKGKCKICNTAIKTSRVYCKDCYNNVNTGGRPNTKPDKYCPNCNKQIRKDVIFCSQKCGRDYKFLQQVILVESQGYIYEHRTHTNAPLAKKYLKYKHGDKCSICGMPSVWNNKPIVLVTDHINGHHDDWSLTNLRLVCPNCDSQLPTYKSKNIGNGRKNRYQKWAMR